MKEPPREYTSLASKSKKDRDKRDVALKQNKHQALKRHVSASLPHLLAMAVPNSVAPPSRDPPRLRRPPWSMGTSGGGADEKDRAVAQAEAMRFERWELRPSCSSFWASSLRSPT